FAQGSLATDNEEMQRSKLGISLGTGFFQDLKLNLVDFNNQIFNSSDELVPSCAKAYFWYNITPQFVFRFSSGLCFSRQTEYGQVNYAQIDSMNVRYKDKAIFSMEGYPAEVALIFQYPLDSHKKMHINFGIGLGYYVYNYRTEGSYIQISSLTDEMTWIEEYVNPEYTLSGWAQFFQLGLHLNLNKNFGAFFEFSKVGLSFMKIDQDMIKQNVYDRKVEYSEKYGYRQRDYTAQSGFDDLTMAVGVFFSL
ncbi:hypothetical protein L0Z72_01720, partial [candidate division KSB1 bacterium]|nr:hypothetical protein [candidate division KSB1 bacterium]